MIRPLTCICMLLAGGSGLYLYQSKHQAQMLDREIARTMKAADAAHERIGVLRGEWALLNEPDRLAALSQEHLGLKTLTPAQFVTAAELAARLPPPALPGAAPEPAGEDIPAPVATALPAPPPVAPPPAPARAATAAKQPQAHAASPSSAAPTRPAAPDGDSAVRVAQHIPGPGIAAVPGYGPPAAVSASVLGGARPLLPPPVPYGSAMAASGASAR